MNGEQKLKAFCEKNYQKKITKVNDRIYHFLGYGHSNAIALIGDTSVILVDTLDCDTCGLQLGKEIGTITEKPVKTIIYTHGHPDHTGGAGAFYDCVEEVIMMAPQKPVLAYYDHLQDILKKRGAYQFGYGQSEEEAICQGIGIREGVANGTGAYAMLPPTTLYQEKEIKRVIDGISMELFCAVGESDDGLCIWLPDDHVICSGDHYYGCWPNTYAIRGTQYRDIAMWIDTLEKILSYPADALLPGHTKALLGYDEIQEVVGNYKDALKSVFLQTLECMNQGMNLSSTLQAVTLSEELRNKEYLAEYYGTIEWTVKGIYQGYVGWFDGDPVHLMPSSEEIIARKLLSLIDDVDKVYEEIMACIAKEDYQLALELQKLLSYVQDDQRLAQARKQALLGRARQMTSANARHYYIASANEY